MYFHRRFFFIFTISFFQKAQKIRPKRSGSVYDYLGFGGLGGFVVFKTRLGLGVFFVFSIFHCCRYDDPRKSTIE